MESLLRKLGLEERRIQHSRDIDLDESIDYSKLSVLDEYIDISKDYLKRAIKYD